MTQLICISAQTFSTDPVLLICLLILFNNFIPQHLLSVNLLEDLSLVVVERPLLDIVSQLPAPVRQKKFAT